MTVKELITNEDSQKKTLPDQTFGVNGNNFFTFNFTEVSPTYHEILEFIQSADLDEEHPAIVFIKDILAELNFDTGIKGGFVLKNIDEIKLKEGFLFVEGKKFNLGRQLCGYLKESTQVAFFLCTAGEDFTRMTNALNEHGDIMEAYILDAIGSLTVEKAMDKIQEYLKETLAEQGMKISNRYSPGYCNWPLSDQQILFDMIGENPTGIALSDSCLMTPRKSISGLIGIGANLKHHEYGCKICNNSDCIYRRILHD